MRRVLALAGVLDGIVERAGRVAAWSGFALVVVMAANVLLRYAFHTGSVAMQELEWHLMAPLTLLGMSYAILHEGHVRVDILYDRFSPRGQMLIELVSHVLVLAVAVILVILSIGYVEQSLAIGERSPDPGGLPYRWALKAVIPAGFVLLALQSLAAALRSLAALAPGTPPLAGQPLAEGERA